MKTSIQTNPSEKAVEPESALNPDILVLGSGLAGMAAALGLAQKGWKVTIVEKDQPPWHRVGESFDWETPILFRQLGINLENLCEQDTLTLKPSVIIWSNTSHKANEAQLLPPPDYMKILKRDVNTFHGNRHLMDSVMLEMLESAGCRFLFERVRKVHLEGECVQKVELSDGREIKAPFYIDASGRASLIAKSAGTRFTPQGQQMVSLYRRHKHHYDGQGTRLYLVDLGEHLVWVWNIHISSETTDIGMVLPAELYKSLSANGNNGSKNGKKKDDIYWEILQKVELLSEFADQSRISGPLYVCSFQNTMAQTSTGNNWLAVGETAYVIDPISSGGVTVALRSGKFASSILDEALSKGQTDLPVRLRKYYHRRLSIQVRFVNSALNDLYHFRKLWNRIGMPIYVRLLVLPQFHINWLSSNFPLRSRLGLGLLSILGPMLGGGVRGLLRVLRLIYRTS